MARSPLVAFLRSLLPGRRPARRLRPAFETLEERAVPAIGTAFFDYEDQTAATGLKTLTMTRNQFQATITRPGSTFEIKAIDASARTLFGYQSLSPFLNNDANPFVITFNSPAYDVYMHGGDFGGDTPDKLRMYAYSGPKATGKMLVDVLVYLNQQPNSTSFSEMEFGVKATDIKSVKFVGGTPSYPNSVYYDNMTVLYQRVDLAAGTGAWDPTKGGITATYSVKGNVISDNLSADIKAYWARSASPSSIISVVPYGAVVVPKAKGTYTVSIPGKALEKAPAGARYVQIVLDADNGVQESDEHNNVIAIPDVALVRGSHVTGTLSAKSEEIIKEHLRVAGEAKVTISALQRTPAEQAALMFDDCYAKGVASQHKIYGSAGDSVIHVYEVLTKGLKRSKIEARRDSIVNAMYKQILKVGPHAVDVHCADPKVLQIIDLEPASFASADRTRFIRSAKADKSISKFRTPIKGDANYHLEIPQ